MSTSNVVIHHPRHPLPERWMVWAWQGGHTVPMTPRHFPYCGSGDEAHDRVQIKLGEDPVFRARWDGWTFFMVPLERAIINRREHRGVQVKAS